MTNLTSVCLNIFIIFIPRRSVSSGLGRSVGLSVCLWVTTLIKMLFAVDNEQLHI